MNEEIYSELIRYIIGLKKFFVCSSIVFLIAIWILFIQVAKIKKWISLQEESRKKAREILEKGKADDK